MSPFKVLKVLKKRRGFLEQVIEKKRDEGRPLHYEIAEVEAIAFVLENFHKLGERAKRASEADELRLSIVAKTN